MKKFKKAASLLLAVIMVITMSVTFVSAATEYTITAPTDEGHTYQIYQILTGDVAADGKTLSNVKAGADSKNLDTQDKLTAALNELNALNAKDADGNGKSDTEKLAAITKYANIDGTPSYSVNSGSSVNVPGGYYIIKDVASGTDPLVNDAFSTYIVQVVTSFTITPKKDVTTVEKKVKDINDSDANAAYTGWQDSADYDIGDIIPYKLTAKLGQIDAYKTYAIDYVDNLSVGLTFQEIKSVKIDGNDVPATGYTYTTANPVEAKYASKYTSTLTVSFADVKALGAKSGSEVVVEYTAQLNANAIVGSAGNPNVVYLMYSNEPYGDGKGITIDDKVTVFTYLLTVNKIDQDAQPLAGAEFTLFKQINGSEEYTELGKMTVSKNGEIDSIFTYKGLDDGNYMIRETKTPDGYNSIPDQKFTVTAEHEVLSDDPLFNSISGTNATEGGAVTFNPITTEGNVTTGLTTNIMNQSGTILPSTGGIGTTIFYVGGGILVVGAALLLITRRRMNREQ